VLTAALLGFCVSAIFIAAAYFTYLFVLFGFAGALMKLAPAWAPTSDAVGDDPAIGYAESWAVETAPMQSRAS
jgi:hypothetical protein